MPIGLLFCSRRLLAVFLLVVGVFGQAIAQAAEPVTIGRLQLRYGGDGDRDLLGTTASLYHKFASELFVLQIYDRESDPSASSSQERIESYIGSPFTWSPEAARFGWVARAQRFSSDAFIPAAGLQVNFNQFSSFAAPLKHYGISTFVQAFVKENEPGWGGSELLHYYAFGLNNNAIQVRGYNVFYFISDRPATWHAWVDFIHPLQRHWDVYVRLNYLNREHHWLGDDRLSGFLGMRFNL